MPYRVNNGQKVLLVMRDGSAKRVTIDRQVDFVLAEIVGSPLEEHRDKGIEKSKVFNWSWVFDVVDKWSTGDHANEVVKLFANDVHQTSFKSTESQSVLVSGSGKNPYTVMIKAIVGDNNVAHSCTCTGYRFRKTCKHLKLVDEQIDVYGIDVVVAKGIIN